MNYKAVLITWFIFVGTVIYFNVANQDKPLSDCHNAEIKIYYDKPMCTKCKLFCEVKK